MKCRIYAILTFFCSLIFQAHTLQYIKQIAYLSCANSKFGLSEKEILNIEETSKKNNELFDITGMLLYSDSNFFQTLEGPAESIDYIMSKIYNDVRHKNVIIVLDRNIPEGQRVFGSWNMALKNVKDSNGILMDNELRVLDYTNKNSARKTDEVMCLLNLYNQLFFTKDRDLAD